MSTLGRMAGSGVLPAPGYSRLRIGQQQLPTLSATTARGPFVPGVGMKFEAKQLFYGQRHGE
jgi:hypothetical protein